MASDLPSPDIALLATCATVRKVVERWKLQSFRPDDIPYASAVHSLAMGSPLVEFKKTGGNEWTVSAQSESLWWRRIFTHCGKRP